MSLKYEKPTIISLNSTKDEAGLGHCAGGSTDGQQCKPGGTAGQRCDANGGVAVGTCSGGGNLGG